jgi:hypothetical protein
LIADADHAARYCGGQRKTESHTADTKEHDGMTQTLLRRKLRAFDSGGLFFRVLTKF